MRCLLRSRRIIHQPSLKFSQFHTCYAGKYLLIFHLRSIFHLLTLFQCILTRADHELFYSGENAAGIVQPQALTCPFCGRLGFTESSLVDHVTSSHSDSSHDSQEVICPICASTPGGDPNHLLTWSDFSTHINLEHRSTGGGGQRDLISFLDEPSRSGAGVRRVPHARGGNGATNGAGINHPCCQYFWQISSYISCYFLR